LIIQYFKLLLSFVCCWLAGWLALMKKLTTRLFGKKKKIKKVFRWWLHAEERQL
jgi:hypothetical protein